MHKTMEVVGGRWEGREEGKEEGREKETVMGGEAVRDERG